MHRPLGSSRTNNRRCLAAWLTVALSIVFLAGCRSTSYIKQRSSRENPLTSSLALLSDRGPQQSVRTQRLLERYDLHQQYDSSPSVALVSLETKVDAGQGAERMYAVAELAYIQGKKAKQNGQAVTALNHFGQAIKSSHQYLFSPELANKRNPYDPQFRGACDLYNQALEETLRLLHADGHLLPGKTYSIKSGDQKFVLRTRLDDNWDKDDFAQLDHFKFVSDYEIATLNNRHTTYGLGVPLIAVRKTKDTNAPFEKHYPDVISFACTALLECRATGRMQADNQPEFDCELVFYNPLRRNRAEFGGKSVPLETDITTPLAFFLDNKQFQRKHTATLGLFNPNRLPDQRGLYMLEAYDPKRIPVLMVHGLWSSPLTWMDMFNDLRSFPEIRERYQFWFYLYPTAQPFWISGAQLRKEMSSLSDLVAQQSPNDGVETMKQMVLVGHSMGGLVSRLQTIDSGNDFWQLVSAKPASLLKASDEDRANLNNTLYFKPNPNVRRVVTIGTPHRGSDYSNGATQWLGKHFIKLPTFLTNVGSRLIRENPGFFRDTSLLTTSNSIDSLSPKSPIFPVLLRAKTGPRVKYHNIIGLVSTKSLLGRIKTNSDGIVEAESAHIDDAVTEINVEAEHTAIHSNPRSILEVRRILLEHAKEIDDEIRIAATQIPRRAIEPVSVTFTDEPAQAASAPNAAVAQQPDASEFEPQLIR